MNKKLSIMKFISILILASAALCNFSYAQVGWDVAVGGQQYFVPIKNASVGQWQPQVMGGVNRFMNAGNTMSVTLRMIYNRNKHQGDALSWQTLFQYTPVVANHLELGVGMGVGYQLAFYPSKSQKWDGNNWTEGKSVKGVWQVPVQFSLGYRGLEATRGTFTPYIAYSTNFLFRYSPDLTPLPSAVFMMGVKFNPSLSNKN
jgi:hypothetical protein